MATLSIQRQSTRSMSITSWLNRKNDFYSSLIDEPVSNRFVLNANHCLVAFIATATAAGVSLLATMVCLVWFVCSFIALKKGGIHGSED